MKHSGALVTALWSCARQFLEPGSLAMCPSTIQGRLTSHSSHQEYKNDRWQCLAEHRQRPSSAKAGTVAQPSIYANVYHPPSNSRNDRHLQMRAIQHRAALAQTSTESREAQGSSASSKEEHPGVPQPASPAPAGGGVSVQEPINASTEPDESAVEQACERMILEAVRLLQEGQLEQAEYLLEEGLRYVEDAVPDTAGVASLLDQLALLQFLLDKLPEAEASARRMSDIAATLFGQDDAAKAMCDLRLGAVLAGQGRWQEAVPLLSKAQDALSSAFGTEYEALGEADFYLALKLVTEANEVTLADINESLIEALQRMRKNVGVGKLLVTAALREHHRVLDNAIKLEDWSRAEALFVQEMRLHEAMDPRGEGLSLLHYQFSTLQFILGRLEDAQKLAQQSFDLALHTYKADSDQAMLRRHRIGTIAAEQRDTAQAEQYLSHSQQHFSKRLGDDNPITGEARFYLAFSRLHVLDTKLRGADPFDRILGPGQRAELLQELTQGLEAMARGFGPEHMLVRKAEQLQRLYL